MKSPAIVVAVALVGLAAGAAQAAPAALARGLEGPVPSIVPVHGCHQTYAHDLRGWHRHGKHCEAQRGLVNRARHNKRKVAI